MPRDLEFRLFTAFLIAMSLIAGTCLVLLVIEIVSVLTPEPPKPDPTPEQLRRAEEIRQSIRGSINELRNR